MDIQIWYAIFSTVTGGIYGAVSDLGEIRTLRMLRSRFESLATVFNKHLVSSPVREAKDDFLQDIGQFSEVWNEIVSSMREEDLISNRERDMLCLPVSSRQDSVIKWPPFLLASKVPIALDIAKDCQERRDADLKKKLERNEYMLAAVSECYVTLKDVLRRIMRSRGDK